MGDLSFIDVVMSGLAYQLNDSRLKCRSMEVIKLKQAVDKLYDSEIEHALRELRNFIGGSTNLNKKELKAAQDIHNFCHQHRWHDAATILDEGSTHFWNCIPLNIRELIIEGAKHEMGL